MKTPTVEIHEILIDPDRHCSVHIHKFKWNGFYVISGKLEIHVRQQSYALVDVTRLGPGDFTTVPPNEPHWFQSLEEPVKALEIYYLEPLSDDIHRETIGGVGEVVEVNP